MANNETSKPKQADILAFINSATPEQLSSLKDGVESKISEDEIEKAQLGTKIIDIKDFNDPRVKPFAGNFKNEGTAIYKVFTSTNKQTTLLNGEAIKNIFGADEQHKVSFGNKEVGTGFSLRYQQDNFSVKFSHYELRVPV